MKLFFFSKYMLYCTLDMFGKDGRRRLSRTRENSCGYSNVTRRISRAVLTQQTTIDSFSYICVCVCVCAQEKQREGEREGANLRNDEGGKGNPYCFSCPINPTSSSYASPERTARALQPPTTYRAVHRHPRPSPFRLPRQQHAS